MADNEPQEETAKPITIGEGDEERVVVRNEWGRLKSVPKSEMWKFHPDSGATYATPTDIARAHEQEKRGGTLTALRAWQNAQAKGYTFGLSDVIGRGLAGAISPEVLKEWQEQRQFEEQEHKILGIGGEITGAAALGLSTGGLGLYGKAGQTGLKGMVAAGALEGALEGAGHEASRWAIGKTKWDSPGAMGEKLAIGAMKGAALGAVVGGAFHGISSGFRATRNKIGRSLADPDVDSVVNAAEKQFGYRPKGLKGLVARFYSSSMGKLKGVPSESILNMVRPDEAGALNRFRGIDTEKALDGIIDEQFPVISALNDAAEEADAVFRGGLKRKQVDRVMSPGGDLVAYQATHTQLVDMWSKTKDMLSKPGVFGNEGRLKKILVKLDELERKMSPRWRDSKMGRGPARAAIKHRGGGERGLREWLKWHKWTPPSKTEMFMDLDSLKRDVGHIASDIGEQGKKMGEDWKTHSRLAEMYENNLRPLLEDEKMWGGAADLQRQVNPAWTAHIKGKKITGFNTHFTVDVPDKDFGLGTSRISRKKFTKYAKTILNPDIDEGHIALNTWLDTNAERVGVLKDVLDLTPEQRVLFETFGDKSASLRRGMEDAADTLTAHNQLKELTTPRGMSDWALAGAVSAGAPGAVAGQIVSAVTSPDKVARMMYALEKLTGRVTPRIKSGTKALFEAGEKVTKKPSALLGPGAAGSFTRTRMPHIRLFTDKRDQIEDNAARKDAFRADIEERFLGIKGGNPVIYDAAVASALRTQDYLYSILPNRFLAKLYGYEDMLPSKSEMQRFMRISEVVDDPVKLLDRLKKKKLTRAEVEAVKETSPALYQEIRSAVAGELVEQRSKGKTIPYRDRIQIGVMLDLETDPSMAPSVFQLIQSGYEDSNDGPGMGQGPPPGAKPSPSPQLSQSYLTGAQKLEEEA